MHTLRVAARLWLLPFAVALVAVPLWSAQPAARQAHVDIRARYDKQVHMIQMRDGVRLYTVVYSPKDASRPYPIMMNRTPYSVAPYGDGDYRDSLGPSERFAEEGYIFAYQDVRGRFMSEGDYVDVRPQLGPGAPANAIDESTDTYDTIEYLVKNVANNNGRVGMWGISYPGFYAAVGMINAHPALKAVSPQAPVAEWFVGDDFHHNGAFFLMDAFRFFSGFGQKRPKPTAVGAPGFEYPMPDAYRFYLEMGPLRNANAKYFKGEIGFWNDMMEHPNYDAFWKARSVPPQLKNIKPAVMTVGGWFDAEDLYGPLHVYEAVERRSPNVPRNMLVMGPWSHGGWARSQGEALGDVTFGSATSEYYRNNVEFPFFQHYLKDAGPLDLPEAVVFATGRNEWMRFDTWPPKGLDSRSFYLEGAGRLGLGAPPADAAAFDEYPSDPAKPVPHTGETTERRTIEYMVEDQRFASRRPDVLVFESEPLGADLTIAGPIRAEVFVETTGTDADFVVKVIDVYPDDAPNSSPRQNAPPMGGFQQLLRWEVMRGRFRDSFERPAPFAPRKVAAVRIELQDVLHTFKKGHRIMVQVQSSMFPLVDRNPQTFVNIYEAPESAFKKATHRIHRSRKYPSRVVVGVLR